MVNGVEVARGRVQPPRAGPQVRQVTVAGRRLTPSEFRTQLRAGRFAGRAAGFGLTPTQQQEAVRREVEQRQADIKRAQDLIEKSKAGLAALPKSEKVELASIIKRVETSRLKPDVIARVGGLSRAQQLLEQNRARLETEGRQLNFQKQSIDLRSKEIAAEEKNLSRLAGKGLLQSSLALTFNQKVQRLNRDVEAFNKRVSATEKRIASFSKAPSTRIPEVARQPTAAEAFPVFTEFRERVRAERRIEPLVDAPAIGRRISETERLGQEIGAGIITPGAELLGARVGGVTGRLIGGIEEAARFAVDVPLFGAETIIGRPIRVEARERRPEVEEIQRRLDVFLGRRRVVRPPTARELIIGAARIPIFGALTGAERAVTPEERVVITRAALRDFATSLALFVGPEAVVAGARAARVGARVTGTQVARARLAARIQLEKALVPRLVQEQAKRLGVAPFQLTAAQLKRLEQVVPTFQEALTQRQLIDLRTLRRAKEFEERVKTALTKQRGELKGFFREERGEFLPRRRRPTQALLQVERPELRIKRPTVVGTLTRFEESLLPVTARKQLARFTERPRVARALRVPSFLGALTAARVGLGEADLFRTTEIQRTVLREFERFQERQRQASLVGFNFLFGQPTALRQRQRQREAEGLRAIQRQFLRQAPPRLRPPQIIREITKPPRPKVPRRPKAILFPIPTLDVTGFGVAPPRKPEGFNVFIRRRGKNVKVNKVPLTKQSARGLGLLLADESARRSGFVRRAKGKARRVPALETRAQTLAFKFRRPRGKTKLARDSFVEKTQFAIDTPQELQGITLQGRIAAERNRSIRRVLKLPKKRKRKGKRKTKRKFKKQTKFFAF